MEARYISRLARSSLSPALVFVATFIAAYAPTVYAALRSSGDGNLLAMLKAPDVVGGLMGFLFSLLLAIGERNYNNIKTAIESLSEQITAQRHADDLQERFLSTKSGPFAPLFGRLAEIRIAKLHKDLENMVHDRFYMVRQSNPVHEYIDIFVNLMLKIIEPKSEFRVVTNELIWSSDSFGRPDRRYLLANYVAATKRRIRIKRIFMVLAAQKIANNSSAEYASDLDRLAKLRDMLQDHHSTLTAHHTAVDLSVYEIATEGEYHSFFKSPSNNFAIWQVAEDARICTVVEYSHGSDGTYGIDGFKFDSDPLLIAEKDATFDYLRARAKDVQSYLQELAVILAKHAPPDPSISAPPALDPPTGAAHPSPSLP